MSTQDHFSSGCTDEFAELCALSTSGALSVGERRHLEQHVLECRRCASLLADYESLTSEGMSRLAAVQDTEREESVPHLPWDREAAKTRLLSKLVNDAAPARRQVPYRFLGIAASVLIAVFAAYQFGLKTGFKRAAPLQSSYTTLRQQLADAQARRAALEQKAAADSRAASALELRVAKGENDVEQLRSLKASLEARAKENSTSLAALADEREALQQKLRGAESELQGARQELATAQQQHQTALLRSTDLEIQVDRLSAQLREHEAISQRQNQYLASDRDVRELMGARQLYIADVFDIDSKGETRKPFGRVFYTRGKSLIFYAFDLDRQPGYREVKTFQAWGLPASSQTTPVSLGIFYMDNESNRRWALKFDDPKVLEEINSVFVTIEPQGGSKKPTNKPFLIAYLHSAPPNHP
jgi:anti-sigma-K factor RskA